MTLIHISFHSDFQAKKWREQVQTVKKDSDTRLSSLVRLSEQHKQEALKSQTLLHRLESHSNAMLSTFNNQILEGKNSIILTRQKVNSLTECLLKAYKIPQELLISFVSAYLFISHLNLMAHVLYVRVNILFLNYYLN